MEEDLFVRNGKNTLRTLKRYSEARFIWKEDLNQCDEEYKKPIGSIAIESTLIEMEMGI